MGDISVGCDGGVDGGVGRGDGGSQHGGRAAVCKAEHGSHRRLREKILTMLNRYFSFSLICYQTSVPSAAFIQVNAVKSAL